MDQLRRVLATIQKYLGQLGLTQRLLIGSVAVIALMAFFIVTQYAGRTTMVELFASGGTGDQQRVIQFLEAANIEVRSDNGKIMVPREAQRTAIAQLAESRMLPTDTSIMFQNILDKQSWQMSRQQNDQLYTIALQNELAGTISKFKDVRSAAVILDIPEVAGLGRTVRKPTASVTVFTASGSPLAQGTVDAIAQFVAGSRAGLELDRVRVIDGSSGRQRKATSDGESLPTTYLEHAAKVEAQTREKLQELLGYIPGVIVAVTAQVDVTQVNAKVQRNMSDGDGTVSLPRRTMDSTMKQSESSSSSEPGVRSNQTADINRGGGGQGSKTDTSEGEVEYENHVGTKVETIVDPRGMPTMLAASINIPRGYVVGLLQQAAAGAAATDSAPGQGGASSGGDAAKKAPTEEEINRKFAEEQARISESILPHLKTRSTDGKVIQGEVKVALMPVDVPVMTGGGTAAGGVLGLGGATGIAFGGGGIIDKAIMGGLALVAMGMMLMMVRKASRKVELPTAEELVGLPPALEAKSDIIGEADEGELAVAGIEVGEEEMRAQKVLEMVAEMVDSSPETAAKIVGQWISVETIETMAH
ncbi:MAG: hypothetical protein IT436_07455 [Phycisphaerales bacterium]|nr:hypothetical protein [Phycisphaerales bacterium]